MFLIHLNRWRILLPDPPQGVNGKTKQSVPANRLFGMPNMIWRKKAINPFVKIDT